MEFVMKLRLLIDTSVWLDLAKDYRQLPIIDALKYIWEANELELILPTTIVEEWSRNKERVIAESKRSLSSHFRLVREAVAQFVPESERDATLQQLHDVDHKIGVSGDPINDAIEQIERLLADAEKIVPTDSVKARAADRAITNIAPFHRKKNSINDAILIETYIDALASRADPEDVYGFVTHNTQDFSERGSDTRLPHPDIASLFDDTGSRYVTNLAALLDGHAHDLVEEVRFEREFSQEPRKLSELWEAHEKLFWQVWYNRKWNIIARVEQGNEKVVAQEEYYKATPEERRNMMAKSTWNGMHAAMKRAEGELGPDDIGPWTDFEWGMINGKLSAIRWVMGDEWDMLDT
jgi:plasmid maintenance system killer protein